MLEGKRRGHILYSKSIFQGDYAVDSCSKQRKHHKQILCGSGQILHSASLGFQESRDAFWKTKHPFLSCPPPSLCSNKLDKQHISQEEIHLNWSCFCYTTVEMFMNEQSLNSERKAAVVGWSAAEDDNTGELHLQDLEVE